ncbi:MAG: hypothetical protein HeimC2_30620 [Candidatus Heimdallarchaeota archaeon LC_2]|nr:MAG: hypothetical protein HeimC2_30620 [Candidatus Heimdallarchaeota archaeon LC_2]
MCLSNPIELIFILGGLIVQVFLPGFPKETLLLQSGADFGFYLGTTINWIGMVLGAQIGYEVVRRSVETGGKFSNLLTNYKNLKLVKYVETEGNRGLFFIRLVPYAPNDVLSLAAGALLLPRKGFFIVSMVTAIPYALFFAYLGNIGKEFIDTQILLGINIIFLIISGLVFLARNYNFKSDTQEQLENYEYPNNNQLNEQ